MNEPNLESSSNPHIRPWPEASADDINVRLKIDMARIVEPTTEIELGQGRKRGQVSIVIIDGEWSGGMVGAWQESCGWNFLEHVIT